MTSSSARRLVSPSTPRPTALTVTSRPAMTRKATRSLACTLAGRRATSRGNHCVMTRSPRAQGPASRAAAHRDRNARPGTGRAGPAGVDEGGEEGVVHRAAGRLLRVDAVLSGHLLDLRRCPREERPASQVRPMGLGIALEHLRRIPPGSTVMATKNTLAPKSVPRRACSPASFAVSSGQVSCRRRR